MTVGSTRFPELVASVLSSECMQILEKLGYTHISVQYGTDKGLFLDKSADAQLSITGFDYSPSIDKEMQDADLIISHAGKPLSIISND